MAVEPGRISLRRKTPEKRRSFSHRRRKEAEEEEEEEEEKCSKERQRQSPVADDEAEIYDGIRAAFPLSFGKQSKSQTSLEAIHNTTRRSVTNKPPGKPSSDAVKTNGLPSLSPSSQTWLSSLRTHKNLNPDPVSNENDDGDAMVGPPPPPPQSNLGDDDDDERDMIGPPRPPAGSSRDDYDSDSDSEANFENRFRIPLSNKIVLKGHTKVVSALAVDHTGSRVVSGSYDYSVRMYDFQGMNSSCSLSGSSSHRKATKFEPSAGVPQRTGFSVLRAQLRQSSASNNSNSESSDSGLLQDRFTDLCKKVFVIGRELLQVSCKSVQRNQDMLISNASAIGKGTVRIVISPFYSHANEKTEFIVICVLTVKMYFRPFLGSGRITPPNWTRFSLCILQILNVFYYEILSLYIANFQHLCKLQSIQESNVFHFGYKEPNMLSMFSMNLLLLIV
ncbi:hypothetical protein DVH24_010494 [Malus domestica]|uniref:Uncharacterized protein n=1 Tax=Malus domestica TaxID=3750 RepID=A0A498JQE4_MALDO|nr:hypothetical protein DVH24_010494 [Malus domestica]